MARYFFGTKYEDTAVDIANAFLPYFRIAISIDNNRYLQLCWKDQIISSEELIFEDLSRKRIAPVISEAAHRMVNNFLLEKK